MIYIINKKYKKCKKVINLLINIPVVWDCKEVLDID